MKQLNKIGFTQINPKRERILNSMGRSQIPRRQQILGRYARP